MSSDVNKPLSSGSSRTSSRTRHMKGSRSSPPIGGTGTRNRPQNRCPKCGIRTLTYDYDYALDCYLGPRRLDRTPLDLQTAIACRLTGRPLFTHTRTLTGRRVSRIWNTQPIPTATTILPEHLCGATTPTVLPPVDREPTPTICPF